MMAYLNELRQEDVVELIGHGVGCFDFLDVVVVQLHVGGQCERIGWRQVLLVRFVVQLVTLSEQYNKSTLFFKLVYASSLIAPPMFNWWRACVDSFPLNEYFLLLAAAAGAVAISNFIARALSISIHSCPGFI